MGEINQKCQVPTPPEIVVQMLDHIGYTQNLYGKRVLENSCGTGNFLIEIVNRYIQDCIAHNYTFDQIKFGLSRDIHAFEKDRRVHKGTIYGKTCDQKWTQYFRTSPNSHFYNPIRQNQYHIKALQKMFPGIPVHSFIVFTSPECDLRVECNELDITVCHLGNLYIPLHQLETRAKIFDINRIDGIFNELATFSPMTVKNVSVEGEPVPFHQYLNTIIKDYHDEKENIKNSFLAAEKTERKKTVTVMIAAAIVCIVCIVLSVFLCFQYRTYADAQIAAAEQELSEFAQKFEHVEDYNNGEVVISSSLIAVSNVSIENASDILDTVNFSCTLTWNGTDYGIQLAEDSKYIVILKDGSVKEYDLFNSSFPYYSLYKIGKGAYSKYDLPQCEFYNLQASDIAYI